MRQLCVIAIMSLGVAACGSALEVAVPDVPRPEIVVMPDVRAGFRHTIEQIDKGDYAAARPRLEYLLARDPTLGDHYLYELGMIAVRTGKAAEAVAVLTRLYREHPRSVRIPAAALEIGRLYQESGRLEDADAFFTVARNAEGDDAINRQAGLAQARVAIARSQPAAAASILSGLRRDHGDRTVAEEARGLLRGIWAAHPELAPAGAGWLDEARLLLREREFLLAEKAVRAGDPELETPEALRLLADALKGQQLPAAATTALAKIVDRFPSHPIAPTALFQMGTLFWNRDEDLPAQAAFEELLRRYPAHPKAPDALYALGRIQQSSGRIRAAIETFAQLARRYPRAGVAWDASWRVGWLHYRNGRFAQAASQWAALARDTRDRVSASAARYWQGRALDAANRGPDARALYERIRREAPASYYAEQAEKRLGIAPASTAGIVPPAVAVSTPPDGVSPYHVTRFEALRAAGLPDLARAELRAIDRSHSTAVGPFLVEAYVATQDYRAAMRIAGRLGSGQLPDGLRLQVSYPLGFWPIVNAEAERYGVDPLLVAAVIRQESLYDRDARSPADAHGLMQLLPSTARREAAELGWTFDPVPRIYDPAVNIPLGVRHLRQQLDRWGGDVVKALAAYNGGSRAVERWERRYGALARDEFVESITYRETREYVKRVLGHYRAYARLYAR